MAGAGYKLFNTGDVLTAAQVNTYLQEQTVMVFASSTARTTALSGVLAEGMMSYLQDTNSVEVYNGTSWVALASGDVTEVQAGTGISVASGTGPIPVVTNTMATAINAAGDLIYGTANDTFTRLGIGTAGQVLKVNSGATAPEWGAAGASFGTWASWTPTLTAATTNPTLGSGAVTEGRYVQNGKVVTAVAFIGTGTTGFAAGSGKYRISLPVNAVSFTRAFANGTGAFIDVSAANGYVLIPQYEATTYFTFRVQAGAYGEFTAANPVALGESDQLHLFFTYEVA